MTSELESGNGFNVTGQGTKSIFIGADGVCGSEQYDIDFESY